MSPILAGICEFLTEKGYTPTPSSYATSNYYESITFELESGWVDLFQRVPDELVVAPSGMEHYIDLNDPDSLDQIIGWLDRLKVPSTLRAS